MWSLVLVIKMRSNHWDPSFFKSFIAWSVVTTNLTKKEEQIVKLFGKSSFGSLASVIKSFIKCSEGPK